MTKVIYPADVRPKGANGTRSEWISAQPLLVYADYQERKLMLFTNLV